MATSIARTSGRRGVGPSITAITLTEAPAGREEGLLPAGAERPWPRARASLRVPLIQAPAGV